ncbi:Putative B3 domain-containing protein At2g27410 [Linum perenne]
MVAMKNSPISNAEEVPSGLKLSKKIRITRKKLLQPSPLAAIFPFSASPPKTVTLFPLTPESKGDDFPWRLKARVSDSVGESGIGKFTLVIRKKLTKTDLSLHHNRLSIPVTKIENKFLTEEEKGELIEKGEIKIGCFVDPGMEIERDEVWLRRWNMKGRHVYNISGGGWKNLLKKKEENLLKLDAGDEIEVWSFRTESGVLCFMIVTVEGRKEADAAAAEVDKEEVMMIEYEGESSSAIDLTLRL